MVDNYIKPTKKMDRFTEKELVDMFAVPVEKAKKLLRSERLLLTVKEGANLLGGYDLIQTVTGNSYFDTTRESKSARNKAREDVKVNILTRRSGDDVDELLRKLDD